MGTNTVVTWEVVGLIATVVTGALGLWWIIEARLADAHKEFLEFKEKVLLDYASITHLEKVENKLVVALGELTKEVRELTRLLYNKSVKDNGST